MEKLKGIIVELIVIVGIFSIITVAGLVDIQIKNSYGNLKDVQTVESNLDVDKKSIYELGDSIIELNTQINALKKQIDNSKNDRDKFNKFIIDYNNKLKDYNAKMSEYHKKLDQYSIEYKNYEKSKGIINWIKVSIGI